MDKNNFSTFLRNNINDTFWDNYIELVRNEMIPYQLMALNDEIDGAPNIALKISKKPQRQQVRSP